MKELLTNADLTSFRETVHFHFEDDFMDDNIRCIPMIVRFKLDTVGIKLKLAEWSRFGFLERNQLTIKKCNNAEEIKRYQNYLIKLIEKRCGNQPTYLVVNKAPAWANLDQVDTSLLEKAKEYNWSISSAQWKSLSNLQRFALLKLYRPGHENKNFPRAMKEFNLV